MLPSLHIFKVITLGIEEKSVDVESWEQHCNGH